MYSMQYVQLVLINLQKHYFRGALNENLISKAHAKNLLEKTHAK